ncbi:MAG: hypothetical protein V4611_04850 [Patescibacteria group bacterium]
MDDIKAKQQVVEKIKEASKILVTVSNSPSVDALSAALGLTLLFDKQEKYATAIFSGEVPPAIAFLEPEKTFDETTDSLRDFIIALNKEKADHLRYKVEGDSVKIFITPYKTTISKDDLEFSQGDYNVELVIALGVDSQEHLDEALENHGQILHDATVITVSAGDQTSDLGGIDWHDAGASSLSEMIAGLGEALKEDKKKPLIDAQIATALLTGIVAETERFSNQHTTSKVMTTAALLMAAGADQQLIATKLQESVPIVETAVEAPQEDINEVADDGSLGNISIHKDEIKIDHDGETLAELDERVHAQHSATSLEVEPEQASVYAPAVEEPVVPQQELPQAPAPEPVPQPSITIPGLVPDLPSLPTPAEPVSETVANVYVVDEDEVEPSLGGTLNATTEQAAEDAHREAMSDQNKTILSHAYLGQTEQVSNPLSADPIGFPGTPDVAPGSQGVNEVEEEVHSAYAFSDNGESAPATPTSGMGGERVITPLPVAPAAPADLGLPLPPPLPDFSQGPLAPPPASSVYTAEPTPFTSAAPAPQPEILGDILAPEFPAPDSAYGLEPIETPIKPSSNDPGQFKIPG